jgi:hypothetical protein
LNTVRVEKKSDKRFLPLSSQKNQKTKKAALFKAAFFTLILRKTADQ